MAVVGFFRIFVFSFQQMKWFELAEMPGDSGSALCGAYCSNRTSIYMTGGEDTRQRFLEYKAINDKWIEHFPLSVGRICHSMVSTSDALFVFGGIPDKTTDSNACKKFITLIEKYSFDDEKWNECGVLVQPVIRPSAAVFGNTIYVLGCLEISGYPRNVVQCVDISSHTTTLITVQSFPQTNVQNMVQCDDKVYAFGSCGVCHKVDVDQMTFETMKQADFWEDSLTHIFQKYGKIYIISDDGNITEFDPLTGKKALLKNNNSSEFLHVEYCAKLVLPKRVLEKEAT